MSPQPAPVPSTAPGGVAFVTGRLAEFALRRVLEELGPELPFPAHVVRLNIAVAALMTADWVASRLELPPGVERVVLPGHCRGDLEAIESRCGVRAERGPKDLRELPAWLGQDEAADDYGAYDIEVIAEVNHVPQLELSRVLAAARHFRESGADVIDLGCDPGAPFAGIGDLVRALRAEGFRVSVDSMEPAEIVPAAEAGAELVLSVSGSNLEVARAIAPVCEVVVIPDEPSSLAGLERSVERLEAWGARYRIDPVLEPIGFGFAASLGRYLEVRRRFPQAAMLMGVGNLTELTDADSAPINVLLLGFCQELGIRSVLTTEVIPWARTSVRECDLARRLVHHAVTRRSLPKHREPRLHLLRDEACPEHGPEVLARLAREIKDRNFRIFAEGGAIHVLARGLQVAGTDPFALFADLGVEDPAHAFYLGYEMAKAVTALTLGKSYVQDEALRWGFLTREEASHLEEKERRRRKTGTTRSEP